MSKQKSPMPVAHTAKPAALPLADASRRLRGRAGRPRKHLDPEQVARASETETSKNGKSSPRPAFQQIRTGSRYEPIQPRLLTLRQTAEYLGLSTWTIRGLVDTGTLRRVQLGAVRRLLFDRLELDRLIEMSR
jgi:excisionase family DNA binding protein